jgi:hypothetical protein
MVTSTSSRLTTVAANTTRHFREVRDFGARRRARRAHSLSPNPGRTASPIWLDLIYDRHNASSAELAKAETINDSYLSRILRLTLIAPEMTEAILAGRQPSTLQLDNLLKPLPSAWAEQRSALFNPK